MHACVVSYEEESCIHSYHLYQNICTTKLVSFSFVKGNHQILVGSYAVADFKINDVRKLMMKHTRNHDYNMSKKHRPKQATVCISIVKHHTNTHTPHTHTHARTHARTHAHAHTHTDSKSTFSYL